MGDVRGVMISERPSLGNSSSSGPSSSVSNAGPGVNIGNYKGVMLCNRPFAGVSGTVAVVLCRCHALVLTQVPHPPYHYTLNYATNLLLPRFQRL